MIEPINMPIKAKGHTAQYQMHKYFARRPFNVFSQLIQHYSQKGDIILDCFCGGGVTIFEGLALDRKVIGVDINPLATFVTQMQIQQVDTNKLAKYYDKFWEDCNNELSHLYEYELDGKKVTQEWMELVYEVICPVCNTIIRLSENNKIGAGKYKCPNTECKTNKISKPGLMRTKCTPYKSIPTRLKYIDFDGKQEIFEFNNSQKSPVPLFKNRSYDIRSLRNVNALIPNNWDRWYEDCLHQKGVYSFSDLFSDRNYYINTFIFNKILSLPESLERELLYFAFSSSLRYTNKMSRVTDNWENGNPTCMDKHAYWLPNIHVECNVLLKLKERMLAIIKGLNYTNNKITVKKKPAKDFKDLKESSDYLILTQSSSSLPIPNESIDVIITDPPYGSNVQYSELSSFWNIWYKEYKGLNNFIFNEEEAISNRKSCFEGHKDINFYGNMLKDIYTEASRVLKPEGYLVFTFNNKDINVWIQLLKAVLDAGFYLPENGVMYQDFIENYKNTSHLRFSGNIHGDFIYSFKKGKPPQSHISISDFEKHIKLNIEELLQSMYKLEKRYSTTELYTRIYSRLINIIMQYLQQGEDKDISNIDNFSKSYIDDLLNKNLRMEGSYWIMKHKKGDISC